MNEFSKSICSFICKFIISEINVFNMDGELFKGCDKSNEGLIVNSIVEVVFIISLNYNFKNFVMLDMQIGSPFLNQLTRIQKEITVFMLDQRSWRSMAVATKYTRECTLTSSIEAIHQH